MKSNIMFKGDAGKDICIEDASITKTLSLLKSKQNGVFSNNMYSVDKYAERERGEQLNLDEL